MEHFLLAFLARAPQKPEEAEQRRVTPPHGSSSREGVLGGT